MRTPKPPINNFLGQVGARIRFLRHERKWTLRKLAKLTACSISSLCELELGHADSTRQTVRKVAQGLKVEVFDLFNLDTDDNDVGFIAEAMRRDKSLVRVARDEIARLQSPS
jgi:transcriptional regulator with XRE-family HTH domain